MKYNFVKKDDFWWLSIRSVEELENYWKNTKHIWNEAFDNLINSKEFNKGGLSHASELAFAIGEYGSNNSLNSIIATLNFQETIFNQQLEALKTYGELFINKNSGYHFKLPTDSDDLIRIVKEDFIFPKYKKDDIKIKKFPYGNHFYVYLNNKQITNGDKVKWNTYEDAYNFAKKYI